MYILVTNKGIKLEIAIDVPCIVGTVDATKKIHDGDLVELDAYNGRINILKKV